MKALLNKDWQVSRNLLLLSLLVHYSVLFIIGDGQLPLAMGLVLALFQIRNIDGQDDKRAYRQLIQSLPVSRREVVAGKFLAHLLEMGVFLVPLILLNALLPAYKANSLSEVLLVGLLSLLLLAGYQFLYTVFGPVFMNYVTVIGFLLLISFGWTIVHSSFVQGLIQMLMAMDTSLLLLSASLLALGLAALFFLLTVKIYEGKDL